MRRVGLSGVELLPYNPSAGAKCDWLDHEYPQKAARSRPALSYGRGMQQSVWG